MRANMCVWKRMCTTTPIQSVFWKSQILGKKHSLLEVFSRLVTLEPTLVKMVPLLRINCGDWGPCTAIGTWTPAVAQALAFRQATAVSPWSIAMSFGKGCHQVHGFLLQVWFAMSFTNCKFEQRFLTVKKREGANMYESWKIKEKNGQQGFLIKKSESVFLPFPLLTLYTIGWRENFVNHEWVWYS